MDYGARAGGSTRLISIVANFKRLNFQVAVGTRGGAPRKAWRKETRKGSRCHAATSILLSVAERGHNHHNDNYVGKCGYGRSGEGGERDGTPIPPPTSCLIRSFANYRRKHRVNCYTRSRPAVVRSVPLFQPSARLTSSPFLSRPRYSIVYTTMLLRRFLAVPREPWKCNVGPRVSFYEEVGILVARERNAFFFGEDSSIISMLYLVRSYDILCKSKSRSSNRGNDKSRCCC